MADKISRRSFLKGTGKTILTAGVLSSGVGLSTSTTPTKVIPKVLKAPPRLWSPKAKAYRSYLREIRGIIGFAPAHNKYGKNIMRTLIAPPTPTADGFGPPNRTAVSTAAFKAESITRNAFEQSITRGNKKATKSGTSSMASKVIAQAIAPDLSHKPEYKYLFRKQNFGSRKKFRAWQVERLSKTLEARGRTVLANKLQEDRTRRQKLVERGLVDKRKNTKIEGANLVYQNTPPGEAQLAKGKQKLLENQQRTVRQEKAAGRLGTKMRNLMINLRSKPRAYK